MRILVVGGSGYVGSATVQKALERGHEVFVVDDLSNSDGSNIRRLGLNNDHRLSLIIRRIGDFSRDEIPGIEGVIYLAASKSVTEGEGEPLAYFENNVYQLASFLLRKTNLPFVFASSAAVYGEPSETLTTQSRIQPTSIYGMTKVVGEKVVRQKCKNARILRYFNIGGATDTVGEEYGKMGNFIPRLFQSENIVVRGGNVDTKDGFPERDYIHVMDVARINVDCVEGLVEPGTYNIASGVPTSTMQLTKMVGRRDYKIEPLGKEEPSTLIGQGDFDLEYSIEDIINSSKKWYGKTRE